MKQIIIELLKGREILLFSVLFYIGILQSFTAAADSLSDNRLISEFNEKEFLNPNAVYWPGYFWLWNAPLKPDVIRNQLRDMAAHGARSVCMLPMPHAFRPDSTNNSMEPDYLTREYFDRIRLAVEEATALGMKWWLYDEGGWPSGQALGKVKEGHPELGQQRLVRDRIERKEPFQVPKEALGLIVEGTPYTVIRPGEIWTPLRPDEVAYLYRISIGGYVDLLNPNVTDRFIELTHEGYRSAIRDYFGKTVHFTFTDEPNAPNIDPGKSIPWSPGLESLYAERFGGNIFDILPALFRKPGLKMSIADATARIHFYDLWTSRFTQAYFKRLQKWSHESGIGSGGHLNGEDQTINAVRYGFGHALRQLRAMDVPGVDLIWRQLFPGKNDQHHFPKYASSVAHQNGTRFAFTESFCVYGNGLTPAQMKWLVDYQYIRGLNLLVIGCYPMSTLDHQMTGERPHFGPCNPLWDHLPAFHAYVARLGYALSVGKPTISTALYYPARDMWAWGLEATETVETHDRLADEMLKRQCDFDLIDDDMLIDPVTYVEGGELVCGAMRYHTIVIGAVHWMHPDSIKRLSEFVKSGGKVYGLENPPGSDGTPSSNDPPFCEVGNLQRIMERLTPTVSISPSNRDIRVKAQTTREGEIVCLFNEGSRYFEGTIPLMMKHAYQLNAQTGRIIQMPVNGKRLSILMQPGDGFLILMSDRNYNAEPPKILTGDEILLDPEFKAQPNRRFIVGEHDFEIIQPGSDASWWGRYKDQPLPFVETSVWKTWLGNDFSGEVDYVTSFNLPESWTDTPLELETGPIEYAATVLLDRRIVGSLLWSPWRIDLPSCKPGSHRVTIRVANTLANELTSERVTKLWSLKKGSGWPSPYHVRALEFERESRRGGIQGPIRLRPSKIGGLRD